MWPPQGCGTRETNESAIRVYNLSKSDVGQTDHQAVVVLKPTGEEEEQITYLCADSAMGTETVFKLECGAVPPLREGMMSRAIAPHLPFHGAPAETIGFFAGIVLQSKQALAQRPPILQEGLRQMVLEAAQLATQEQTADIAKHRMLIDAGDGASSPAAVEHAEHGAEFSTEFAECLKLITTEPEAHYGICLTGLNWRSGRAICLTSNIGIPEGPSRNKIVSALMRDGFTATVVRVFSCATATDQVHHGAMAFARSCIDRFIGAGVFPTSMTDRLQCTTVGHQMRLLEPTSAAHAAVTPLTLSSRFHTVSMTNAQNCSWAYDQLDRHQMSTAREVSGELDHDWSEAKASAMMQQIQEVAKYEGISVDLTVASATKIIITPGSSPNDNTNLERACIQYCDRLRKLGEAGLSCHFVHAPPYRPNPIPQTIQSMLQYEPDVAAGITHWSTASARAANGVPLRAQGDGSAQTFLATALAGTGRFRSPPASDETALALRSTNSELVKSNVALKQQVAKLGAEQLALRTESNQQMAAFVEAHRAENRRYQEPRVYARPPPRQCGAERRNPAKAGRPHPRGHRASRRRESPAQRVHASEPIERSG